MARILSMVRLVQLTRVLSILRFVQTARSCVTRLFWLLLVLGLLGCAAFSFVAGRASADEVTVNEMVLVLDHSQSMWTESDPEQLRLEAAQLFISLVGVRQAAEYEIEVGAVAFGSQAHELSPLLRLPDSREALMRRVEVAEPMGWTDIRLALSVAREMLSSSSGQPGTIVLLTDGVPETEETKAAGMDEYLLALRDELDQLALDGITLEVLLLAFDADGEALAWWEEMSRYSSALRLRRVTDASDLPYLYATIAADMNGRTIGERLQVDDEPQEITVADEVDEIDFVVNKGFETGEVTLKQPSGEVVTAKDAKVQVVRAGRQEIWSLRDPMAGVWEVMVTDDEAEVFVSWPTLPIVTPTATRRATMTMTPTVSVTKRATRTATATASPTATYTATATESPTATYTATATESPTATYTATASHTATVTEQPTKVVMSVEATVTPMIDSVANLGQDSGQSGMAGGWVWLLLFGVVGTGGVLWQRARGQALVDGTLRVVAGGAKGQRWQLDEFAVSQVTIGEADVISLSGLPSEAASLRASREGDEVVIYLLAGSLTPVMAGQPVQKVVLWDRDLFTLGAMTLRYENVLRQR